MLYFNSNTFMIWRCHGPSYSDKGLEVRFNASGSKLDLSGKSYREQESYTELKSYNYKILLLKGKVQL
jgi:hypothetical protein